MVDESPEEHRSQGLRIIAKTIELHLMFNKGSLAKKLQKLDKSEAFHHATILKKKTSLILATLYPVSNNILKAFSCQPQYKILQQCSAITRNPHTVC